MAGDNIRNNMLRILIVHNYYQIPGGEDIVVSNERQMLEEHGHKVTLYTRNNAELKNMGFSQKLRLPFNTIFNIKTYKEVKHIIKAHHIDIVHVHNTLNLISPSVYYAARICKIPIVQTVHNFRLICPGATLYRNGHICEDCLIKGLGCAVKHNCYRNSKLQTLACVINMKFHRMTGIYGKLNYICLTEFNKEKILKLKQIKKEQVFVKPNFIQNNGKLISSNQRNNQFIFAGRLDRSKGITLLLEAWMQLGADAPKLIICGIGPMEDWCRKFIEKNNINAELKGFVSRAEILKLIADSRALILPTQLYEGFPMSIIEAFSVGTPVLCSDLGNAGNVVTENVTGYKFKGNSVDGLISAINRLATHENIYPKVFNEYTEKYTIEKNYDCLIYIYKKITEN